MLPEKVDEMLKNYRTYLGRCKYLEGLIPVLQSEYDYLQSRIVEDNTPVGNQAMDGMPHSPTPGNPTERLGIMFASGFEPDYLKEKRKELEAARKEYNEKLPTVVFVEAWLKGLTEREKWIIENQVIDEVSWREIGIDYLRKFGESRTKYALRNLRDQALSKIYDIAA